MGAISVDGFDGVEVEIDASRSDPLVVDCMRHSISRVCAAEVRVPCVGGMSAGSLLGLCARVPGRTVVIADDGRCASCDSGGAIHPAAAMLDAAVALMRETGVPDHRLPRLQAREVHGPHRQGASRNDPLQSRGRSRRGFFTALARPATQRDAAPRTAAFTVPSAERRSIVDALESLARRHGGRMPAGLFHRLNVNSACQGHRVCAAACPTGALVRYRDDASRAMGSAFDSAACIGCGHCTAVCPEQALELHHGGGPTHAGHRPVTRFQQRECTDCGARFASTASSAETRCERCRKSARLARAAFATLSSARPRLQDME
jgi:ferredoxin